MLQILFRGRGFLLIGSLEQGGAIATPTQYSQGLASEAHLYADGPDAGKVMRYGEPIGVLADIEVLGPAKEPSLDENWFDNFGDMRSGWGR